MDSSYSEQQESNPQANYIDARQEMNPELILKLVDGSDIMEELMWKMKGFVQINGEWAQIRKKPFINDDGISDVIGLLNFIVSKNTSMSGIEDWTIENIAEEFNFNLNGLFFVKGKEYEIEPGHYSILAHLIASSAYIGLRRGRVADKESLGATLKFLKSTFVEQHSFTTPQPHEKGGIFSSLNIFRRNK